MLERRLGLRRADSGRSKEELGAEVELGRGREEEGKREEEEGR